MFQFDDVIMLTHISLEKDGQDHADDSFNNFFFSEISERMNFLSIIALWVPVKSSLFYIVVWQQIVK